MTSVLFAASEAYPLMKTGGLGDVAGSLPPALQSQGGDVRLILPAYQDALERCRRVSEIASLPIPEVHTTVRLLETVLPGTRVKTWLVQHPLFDRPGNPYHDRQSRPWPDSPNRFALFARAIAALAEGDSGVAWRPDVLHCHDWQTGLAPALLSRLSRRPATVFTIHNLAYQGLFPQQVFRELLLPDDMWAYDKLEFHGQLSFMKGGLVYADHLTTVSPTYAKEIQTPEFGHGLDGVLRHRHANLSGILNGIDERTWYPGRDPHLAQPYTRQQFELKAENKRALQRESGLDMDSDTPVIGIISRLVEQKGTDLVIEALPGLLRDERLQWVVLGSGNSEYERALEQLAAAHPRAVRVHLGYDEALAHRIEGGADMFLMPSRFEPCGLNQLYSLRYGTPPIVRRVGGLADTVTDSTPATLAAGTATGVVFDAATGAGVGTAVQRALALYRQPAVWRAVARTGMKRSFSWRGSAKAYMHLYETLLGPGR